MACYDFDSALLRRPGYSVVDGLSANAGPAPTYDGVIAEHRRYAETLGEAGVTVELLNPLEDFPDSIFVEDPALVFPEGAVLLRPGAPSRRDEAKHLAPVLAGHFPIIETLAGGHADGGDVMVTPELILIGLSSRTDRIGAQHLVAALDRLGRRAQIVAPPEGALHLKTVASLIDEETVLTTPAGEASGLFARFRQIVTDPGEEGAANALRVNRRLLVASQYPRTVDRLARDYDLLPLSTENISRIDAGLSCMSLRWKAPPKP
jgi:dimethylargininase